MTKNDTGTLCVRFIPDINDAYPLSVIIVDDKKNQIYLQIRTDDIDPLMACLWTPMMPAIRLITMTGDYVIKWWNYHEVAFMDSRSMKGTHLPTVLQHKEAAELVGMVRHEMSCASSISISNPLDGAKRRTNDNLRGVFA